MKRFICSIRLRYENLHIYLTPVMSIRKLEEYGSWIFLTNLKKLVMVYWESTRTTSDICAERKSDTVGHDEDNKSRAQYISPETVYPERWCYFMNNRRGKMQIEWHWIIGKPIRIISQNDKINPWDWKSPVYHIRLNQKSGCNTWECSVSKKNPELINHRNSAKKRFSWA